MHQSDKKFPKQLIFVVTSLAECKMIFFVLIPVFRRHPHFVLLHSAISIAAVIISLVKVINVSVLCLRFAIL